MYAVVWVHCVDGVSAGGSGQKACMQLLSESPLVIRRSVTNRFIRQLYIRIGRDTTSARCDGMRLCSTTHSNSYNI